MEWHRIAQRSAVVREPAGWSRQPLVPAAVAFAGGIVADRFADPPLGHVLWASWASAVLWAAAIGLAGYRRVRGRPGRAWLPSACLLTLLCCLGAAWHHVYAKVYRRDDIGCWAGRQGQPAELRGVVGTEPTVVPAGEEDPLRVLPARARSVLLLRVDGVRQAGQWVPASGWVQLVVGAELTGVHAGDRVVAAGLLAAPRPARNPGQFDYRRYLGDLRIRARLRCDYAAAVRVLGPGQAISAGIWVQRLSGRAERLLRDRLRPPEAQVAVALLLGRYRLLEEDVRNLFVATGTMHLLAISGLHLGILTWFLWRMLSVLPVRRKLAAAMVGLTAVGYAVLAGARPSVLRAAVLVAILTTGVVLGVRSRRANSLAAAALIVLGLRPTDLFSSGFQLSFLAVGALFWAVPWVLSWRPPRVDALRRLTESQRPKWLLPVVQMGGRLRRDLVTYLVVWLSNAPLVAARFHVFSPIVTPLSAVLIPILVVVLISGLGLLMTGWWLPGVGAVLGGLCGQSIRLMICLVGLGAKTPGGHFYVPGPTDWWLAGFYVGAAVLLVRANVGGVVRWRRWAAAACAWSALGLAAAVWPADGGRLRCQVLDVGAGSATVLHLPDGRTVLVDAGQVAGPQVGSRVVAPALWQAGVRRISAVFVSHADVDHFNGLALLVDRFRIDRVFFPPQFAASGQEAVRVVCELLRRRRVDMRVCWAGDRIDLGSQVSARVLHPPVRFGGTDNETSLVLLVEYRGKRLLLPGDLEGAGRRRLLGQRPQPVNLLLAPHHGSAGADPAGFVRWCRPQLIVVSRGWHHFGNPLRGYGRSGVPVLSTDRWGCIDVWLSGAGMRVEPFLE